MGFSFQLPDGFFGGALGFSGVFAFLIGLVVGICAIAIYAMQAIGLYNIGKRRGIRSSWLSWIPLGNLWVLGSISDQFQYAVNGRECNRRKILVRLTVLTLLVSLFSSLCSSVASVVKVFNIPGSDILIGASVAISVIAYVVVAVLSILLTVYEYIALCDLYRSCVRAAAVPLMILTIAISPAIPFVIFFLRNKDSGMAVEQVEESEGIVEAEPEKIEE